MRLPDIYIIGAQKSGTTTLYDWLAQHPQIFGDPLAKDFPFFSQDSLYEKGAKELAKFSKGAKPNQLVLGGEANAMFVENAGERLYKVIPKAKLIAILRNPVDRAYSAYCYAVERLIENRTFEQAIKEELEGYCYSSHFDSMQKNYLRHGLYAQQLKSILKYYPKEQLLVVIFEEWKRQPMKVMRDIFEFVGVNHDFTPVLRIKNVTKGRYRSRFIAKMIHWQAPENSMGRLLKLLVPFRLRTAVRRKLAEINRGKAPKPDFPDFLRELLKDYYRKDIQELEKIIGRKLKEWY